MKEFCKYVHFIIYALIYNIVSLTADQVNQDDEFVDSSSVSQDNFNSLAYSPEWQPNWPNKNIQFGQVSGVSVDNNGNVYVFHRGDRKWTTTTFTLTNKYLEQDRGPINSNTIVALNSTSGQVLYAWGKNLFYMPHGITVDMQNNVWVTDVALHQVFKFPLRKEEPLLTLGVAFVPGSDKEHFCKPTDVAVMSNGDFFVSDGYCNNRIIKFSSSGTVIAQIGTSARFESRLGQYQLNIPHGLTLAEPLNQLCTADRQNGRVMCYDCHNTTYVTSYSFPALMGEFIYSVAYSPRDGGKLFVINFPPYRSDVHIHVRGFVINIPKRTVESQFGAANKDMKNPHDIAISRDGTDVYVVELQPHVIHKFSLHPNPNLNLNLSSSQILVPSTYRASSITENHEQFKSPSTTIIIIVAVLVVIGTIVITAVAVVSKLRKRGCILVPTNGRKQQWEVSATTDDGFKLSHLLERRAHPGFEKLNTEESDEDNTASA